MIRECDVTTGTVTERPPTAAEQTFMDACSADWTAGAPARLARKDRFDQAVAFAKSYLGIPDPTALSQQLDAFLANPPTNADVITVTRANVRMARALGALLRRLYAIELAE